MEDKDPNHYTTHTWMKNQVIIEHHLCMMYLEKALSLLLVSSLGPLASYGRLLENRSPAIFRELLEIFKLFSEECSSIFRWELLDTLKLSYKNVIFLGGVVKFQRQPHWGHFCPLASYSRSSQKYKKKKYMQGLQPSESSLMLLFILCDAILFLFVFNWHDTLVSKQVPQGS